MKQLLNSSRRNFLKSAATVAGATYLSPLAVAAGPVSQPMPEEQSGGAPDYAIRIAGGLVEIANNKFISTTTYNGQFPGPLLRFKESQRVNVAFHNDTDTPEQFHWHGQIVPVDVDGASEEGTPYIPAHGVRRISFTPQPSGLRFYHTHVRGGDNLARGQYTGQVGPVYIEPKHDPGRYDREVFLTLKEFEPWFSHGGDMAQDFLAGEPIPELKKEGEAAMHASQAKGMPKGYEVNYRSFTINGRMLGHGEPIRVKQGERVLFHVLNGSATEMRSLALPGHMFEVVATDGNAVPKPASVPVLWLGTAERISAIVEMNHPGVWVMGDLADDDRAHGMGIDVEYAGHSGKPVWVAPPKGFKWDYTRFGTAASSATLPTEATFEMRFKKDNAADGGFNRWTINGVAYPDSAMQMPAAFHVKQGRRYKIRMLNVSDDIHPVHLHRHTFELTHIHGKPTAGVLKDVVMLPGYGEVEIQFTANNPGRTLFHCHQQLHMDFGFMTLFDYV
jgi:FtsP/CotA-like multicopper oxidase with cupredoxin domain